MAAPVDLGEVSRHRTVRAAWLVVGFAAVALGGVGVVVPGLPTTVFFIIAAWAFSKSSPRFERWVLGLPGVGPMVRDHREGLGMPRRAKVLAITMIVVACTLSATLGFETWTPRLVVGLAGAVGVGWILLRVPTRETVLAARAR
ncbi:YbaN family protein [Iamia sp.]|uniref:YbaN family protein n=1 Tax=Iamia sp. TaxID=2722710 RepID=UPI002C535BE3|nr:YbaN family protein [Iamia sp.]HXH57742.1 YbaN family protein [Iamia sp.]